MNFEYVKQHYGVPAEFGRLVKVYGEPGIIAEDRGHYIGVNFDADKPGVILNAHPTSEVEYLGMGKIRKPSRSAARFAEYWKRAECYDGFASWLGFDMPKFEQDPWRYSFFRMVSSRAKGDWCATKKAARASYKKRMQESRAQSA